MRNQIFVAFVVNFLSINYGIAAGWVAPNLPRFQTEDSPIGMITSSEAAFIVSSMCIGGLVGSLIFGILCDLLGRKWTLICSAIPQIIGNLLVVFGTNTYYIYASRLLFGFAGGAVFTVLPIFVSEISRESIRGALGTLLPFNWLLGIVLGYVFSSWIDYFYVPLIPAGIGVAFLLIFMWVPESPDFLLHSQKIYRAKLSYDFYDNHRGEIMPGAKDKPKFSWKHFKDPAVKKGIFIAVIMIWFADTCGVFIITNYVTEILHWANIEMDVYVVTVTLGLLQVLGCAISCVLMDRFGRRILFMVSALISSIAMYSIAAYFYLQSNPNYKETIDQLHWLPVASFSVAILAMSLAIGSAPFFLIAELLPMNVRGPVTTTLLSISWVVAFIVVHSFYFTVEIISVGGIFSAYASVCIIEFFFVYFVLPETKNLTIDEIQDILRGQK